LVLYLVIASDEKRMLLKSNPEKLRKVMKTLLSQNNLTLMTEYNAAVWRSAKESAKSRKKWLDPQLVRLEKKVRTEFRGVPNIENSLSNGRRLINAAITGEPLKVKGRQPMLVNKMLADNVLANLNGKFKTVERLLDPVWKD
tara:strand:- start:106 stop:531 length:426 start_codon:yes stop_codon:yes gene_type:complete